MVEQVLKYRNCFSSTNCPGGHINGAGKERIVRDAFIHFFPTESYFTSAEMVNED